MVPTLARLSTKSMAESSGPAMPRDSTMVVMKVSTGRLPPAYRSQPTGRMVIMVVGEMALDREMGSWQLFIQW